MVVIGISGKIGSGKDTLGDYFCNRGFIKISFARRLKEVVATLTSTTLEENLSQRGKNSTYGPLGLSLGTLQQKIGILLRDIDDKIWIKILFSELEPDRNYVITDLRFKNEADFIKKWEELLSV